MVPTKRKTRLRRRTKDTSRVLSRGNISCDRAVGARREDFAADVAGLEKNAKRLPSDNIYLTVCRETLQPVRLFRGEHPRARLR